MNRFLQKLRPALGISVVLFNVWGCEVREAFAEDFPLSSNQAAVINSAAKQCPTNLSSLQPKMEKALQFIKSASFRNTMLTSLQASIPEAIAQADGLTRQITFLEQEISGKNRSELMQKKWHEKDSLILLNHSNPAGMVVKALIAMQWINTSFPLRQILPTRLF